ncbi:hypothetical protein BJ742DRAFT_846845 [Cladochytrium replicatum]|nr:hypothetical protein BJ742DRAFT_846845 [Cladochytrium replicatum]
MPARLDKAGIFDMDHPPPNGRILPRKPSPDQQSNMIGFLNAFVCASHLPSEVTKNRPKVASNLELSLLVYQTHSEVNRRRSPEFDCSCLSDGRMDGSCD